MGDYLGAGVLESAIRVATACFIGFAFALWLAGVLVTFDLGARMLEALLRL